MISNLLEGILRNASPMEITEFFLWAIVGVFLLSLYCAALRIWKGLVAYTPNLLTSMGILGTFIGIVVGLMGFDPSDIDHSITNLLQGLKTAFITSLAGMGGSIVFKVLSTLPVFSATRTTPASKDIGPALVHAMEEQAKRLEALRRAVAGDEESSLAGQLKLFRGDVNDHARQTQQKLREGMEQLTVLRELSQARRKHFEQFADKLWRQMEAFGEMLSKSATEQVINALKEVIVDFNKNLTEQFGDNFKALDASVKRLVDWQENYRRQLEQMQAQYQQGVEAITATEAAVAHISEESRNIPVVMERLGEVVRVNQHQIDELDRHLEAFAQTRDRAVEAVPEIRARLEEISTAVTDSTTVLNENLRNMAALLSDSYTHLSEQVVSMTQSAQQLGAQLQKDTAELQERVAEAIDQMQQRLHATIDEVLEAQARETNRALEGLTTAVKTAVQRTGDGVNTQLEAIDQMQQRLHATIDEVLEAQARETNRALEGLTTAVKTAVQRTGDGVNTQLEVIDQAMQREVERVMNEMGQALARISHQFTTDYSQLVAAMDRIVRQRGTA